MTREEKSLLLKDLCARLMYGVKIALNKNVYTAKGIDLIVTDEGNWEYAVTVKGIAPIEIGFVKPYLRPIEKMTEREWEEFTNIYNWCHPHSRYTLPKVGNISEPLEWLNEHHIDYNGLIEKGLALEAPEGMYNTKTE